jgi:hypothetical protein
MLYLWGHLAPQVLMKVVKFYCSLYGLAPQCLLASSIGFDRWIRHCVAPNLKHVCATTASTCIIIIIIRVTRFWYLDSSLIRAYSVYVHHHEFIHTHILIQIIS